MPRDPSGEDAQVRIATFNILHGRSMHDGEVLLDRYADSIRSLDADILGLQEVDRDQPRSAGADLTAVAAAAMGAPEHRFVAALAGTPGGTWTAATGAEQPGSASYGVALLSRYPVRSWQVVRLPMLRTRVPFLAPDTRRPILIQEEPRVAVAAVIQTPLGDVTVAVTHLTFLPGWNTVQLRRLTRSLRGANPLILMGDLNMGPTQARRNTALRPLASAPTFPVTRPVRQLDHILARGHFGTATDAVATALPVSDHRALSVDV